MMSTQRRDTEKYFLIEEGKKEELMELLNAMNVLITVKSLKSKKMLSYCLKCRKNTENISSRVSNTNSGKTMILSKCAICGSKKWRFIKNQEAKGILSNLGLKSPLSKIHF